MCQTLRGPDAGRPGVGNRNAVVKWRIGADYRSATWVSTIVDGLLPVPLPTDPEASQGRHVGCRLRFDGAGPLYISVGDGRTPTGPVYEFRFDAQSPAIQIMVGTPLCSAPAYATGAGTAGSTTLAFRMGDGALSVAGTTVGWMLSSAPALLADRTGPGITAFARGLDNALGAYSGAPGSGTWSSLGGVLN